MVSEEERFKLEYKEVGDYIRHYSSVRSALTSFLITVGLAAFSAYFRVGSHPCFLAFTGVLMIVAAVLSCLVFSYRTEHANLYQTKLWKASRETHIYRTGTETGERLVEGFKSFDPHRSEVWQRMLRDPMNWVLVIGAALMVLAFVYANCAASR